MQMVPRALAVADGDNSDGTPGAVFFLAADTTGSSGYIASLSGGSVSNSSGVHKLYGQNTMGFGVQ